MIRPRFFVLWLLAAYTSSVQISAEGVKPRPYKPKGNDFVVVCTLFNGPAPGATQTTPKVPITYDPRFAIGARIDRIVSGKSPWQKGELVTFVIHSPTLMLGNRFTDEQFTLTFSHFHPTTKNDKVWFEPEMRYLVRWIERTKPAQ